MAELDRNGWPKSIGISGRIESERVADLERNTQFHHACADRVQNYIPADFQEMRVLLDKDGLVSALEEVPCSVASVVEELSVYAVQLSHAEGEVSVRGFDQEMVMVVHEAVGVA